MSRRTACPHRSAMHMIGIAERCRHAVSEGCATKLISERIEVEFTESPGGLKEPAAFVWRGERHVIRRIVNAWVDAGFGAGEVTRTWYRRRHRNVYRVETDQGELYEIYLDRSGSKREWVLARKL